jgi:RNA recognition motif-containing protein
MENTLIDTKLYVGNLAYATTEHDLRNLFAQAGNVTAVDLVTDQKSGKSKGFAFVTMDTPAEAQIAIGMFHESTLAERTLKVTLSRKHETPGGNRGRLGAFQPASQNSLTNARKLESAHSAFQSRYSAFGDRQNANPNSTRPRRRGGSQRH